MKDDIRHFFQGLLSVSTGIAAYLGLEVLKNRIFKETPENNLILTEIREDVCDHIITAATVITPVLVWNFCEKIAKPKKDKVSEIVKEEDNSTWTEKVKSNPPKHITLS